MILTHSVCSFDFGNEQFSSVPLPPLDRSIDFRKYGQISAGPVGGSLCLYDQTFNDQSDVWVMKKYGWHQGVLDKRVDNLYKGC